jgi:WD40 repeat protein
LDKKIQHWSLKQQQQLQNDSKQQLTPGTPIGVIAGHSLRLKGLAVNPDDTLLCSASRDYSVRLWDVKTGDETAARKIDRNVATCLRWIPDSDLVLQGSEDLTLRVWDTRSMQVVQTMETGNYFAVRTACYDDSTCRRREMQRISPPDKIEICVLCFLRFAHALFCLCV